MFDGLNRFGLPVKYAIILGVAAPMAILIMNLKNPAEVGAGGYLWTAAFGAACGAIAGFMRQLRGMSR
ncbi:MAG: hypothetical protein H6880_02665 [Rhodobiaceae bacterium]|nr:hypothetical protein [Rhodobiaceae bacterium]